LDKISVGFLGEHLDLHLLGAVKLREWHEIDLGEDDDERFGLEKWLDIVEKRNLLLDGVTTGFRDIKQEQNASVQMC
jgi:hypothetical protein